MRKRSSQRHKHASDIVPTQTDIPYTSSHRYHADVQPKIKVRHTDAFITFVTEENQNSTQSTKTNASRKDAGMESKLVTKTRQDKSGTQTQIKSPHRVQKLNASHKHARIKGKLVTQTQQEKLGTQMNDIRRTDPGTTVARAHAFEKQNREKVGMSHRRRT